MDQAIVPFDLHRMLLGDAPPLFLLEIVLRCVVIYGWTLLLLRWIGSRSVAQLSLVEFLLVIALGSAVGDALFYPEVPLVHAMLAILVVVLLDKAIDTAILRWPLAKRAVDGDPVELIREGRILQGASNRRTMGAAELEAALRTAGVRNLGEVSNVWLEASGKLSFRRRARPMPGLAIMPPRELEAPGAPAEARELCCAHCGLVLAQGGLPADARCPECGRGDWTQPVLS